MKTLNFLLPVFTAFIAFMALIGGFTFAVNMLVNPVKAEQAEIKADITEIKADITEIKAEQTKIKADITEIKAELKELKTDITEIKNLIRLSKQAGSS